jgi:hypothetical protein
MKIHALKREQLIRRPIGEVFEFFSRPENLALLTPSSLAFQMITPVPILMKEGAVIDYTIRVAGFPLRWTTLITEFQPNSRFVDLQLRGPYSYWHHTHMFLQTPDGTLVTDEVRYALPFGVLGFLAHTLFVRQMLRTIFEYRNKALSRVFSAA